MAHTNALQRRIDSMRVILDNLSIVKFDMLPEYRISQQMVGHANLLPNSDAHRPYQFYGIVPKDQDTTFDAGDVPVYCALAPTLLVKARADLEKQFNAATRFWVWPYNWAPDGTWKEQPYLTQDEQFCRAFMVLPIKGSTLTLRVAREIRECPETDPEDTARLFAQVAKSAAPASTPKPTTPALPLPTKHPRLKRPLPMPDLDDDPPETSKKPATNAKFRALSKPPPLSDPDFITREPVSFHAWLAMSKKFKAAEAALASAMKELNGYAERIADVAGLTKKPCTDAERHDAIADAEKAIKDNLADRQRLMDQEPIKDAQIAELAGQVKDKDILVEQLRAEVKEKDQVITQLRTHLEAQINERDTQIKELDAQVKTSEAAKAKKDVEIAGKNDCIAQLEKQLKGNEEAKTRMDDELKPLRSAAESCKKTI
jgi:hypothetical protein